MMIIDKAGIEDSTIWAWLDKSKVAVERVSKLKGTLGKPKVGRPPGNTPKLDTVGTFKFNWTDRALGPLSNIISIE